MEKKYIINYTVHSRDVHSARVLHLYQPLLWMSNKPRHVLGKH